MHHLARLGRGCIAAVVAATTVFPFAAAAFDGLARQTAVVVATALSVITASDVTPGAHGGSGVPGILGGC